MHKRSLQLRADNKRIGLVPTMGALHKGHLSLLDCIAPECDVRIMSIFVNPIQFGPKEDFSKYPRTFEADCQLAESAGCDIIFAPDASLMYPKPFYTEVSVNTITSGLCGASRPGHFTGVATVVLKFFNIVLPHVAVFGQKDAQQVAVIKRMVFDLNVPVTIVVAPIFREPDGLAMSSRNVYLTPHERQEVTLISQGLFKITAMFDKGESNADVLKKALAELYQHAQYFRVEYIQIVDISSLLPLASITDGALVAVACRTVQSNTRLIDNTLLGGRI